MPTAVCAATGTQAATEMTDIMNDKINNPTTGRDDVPAKPSQTCERLPKWAAVVNDALVLLPEQHVTARLIKHEAGTPADLTLVRDHGSPNDVPFEDETRLDLSDDRGAGRSSGSGLVVLVYQGQPLVTTL